MTNAINAAGNVDVTQTSPEDLYPLGAYRDPNVPGYYNNDPIMETYTDLSVYGAGEDMVKKNYGILGSLSHGSAFKGSYRIVVWGKSGKPSSWAFYDYAPNGKHAPGTGKPLYGWVQTHKSLPDILNLEFTKSVMDKY